MKTKYRSGFTLVELNLSIFFVAILILGIALTTMQVSRMYQKGMTVRTVNQVGSEVLAQIKRDFASGNPSVVDLTQVSNGRMCLGSASYLFNDAVTLNDDSKDSIKNPDGSQLTLVRVVDGSAEYCKRDGSGAYLKPGLSPVDEATELLATDSIPLAVHGLAANKHVENEASGLRQAVYSLKLSLGTNEVDTTTDDGYCLPPSSSEANFDACFVSEFEAIIRAGEVTR